MAQVPATTKERVPTTFQKPEIARQWIGKMAGRLARILGEKSGPFIETGILALANNPKLLEATSLSVIGCFSTAASLRLYIGGPAGQCYMVPYTNKKTKVVTAQWQMGYKGYPTLAKRSGSLIRAHAVLKGDHFEYDTGTNQFCEHRRDLKRSPTDRIAWDDIVAAFAIHTLPNGLMDLEVAEPAILQKHRDCSQAYRAGMKYGVKAGERNMWITDVEEAIRKTVLSMLGKRSGIDTLVKGATLSEQASLNVPQGLELVGAQMLDIDPAQAREQAAMAAEPARPEIPAPQAKSDGDVVLDALYKDSPNDGERCEREEKFSKWLGSEGFESADEIPAKKIPEALKAAREIAGGA